MHNLWYHILCHAGKFVTDNIDKVVERVPSFKARNPFFSFHACSKVKITQNMKGYNKEPLRATSYSGQFNMGFGFSRGKTVTNNEDGSLITSKEGYNY